MMRNINLVLVHCSASDDPTQDSPEAVIDLHMGEKGRPIQWGPYETTKRGWDRPGYAWLITKDGQKHQLFTEERPTWHCKGHNANSIGICLTGNKEFSEAQFKALKELVDDICQRHGLRLIDVLGHYELNPAKPCPNFNVAEKLAKYQSGGVRRPNLP